MPTVPVFNTDQERIAWLQRWFVSEGDLNVAIVGWDATVQRCDKAVTGAGYAAAGLTTMLSSIQAILTSQESRSVTTVTSNNFTSTTTTLSDYSIAIHALSYVEVAIGCLLLLLGFVCKIKRESYANSRDQARAQFPPQFFQPGGAGVDPTTHADIVWTSPRGSPVLLEPIKVRQNELGSGPSCC